LERRQSIRVPIERPLRYTAHLGSHREILVGTGKTIDISRTGMLFTSEHELPTGTHVEIDIEWMNHIEPLGLDRLTLLMIGGFVVRHSNENVALQIEHFEFRSRDKERRYFLRFFK
jgi:c-di-GMP-binding flagellar brake protein YcgR